MGGPGEDQNRFVHAGGFYHAAVFGDIAVETGQPSFKGERILQRANTTTARGRSSRLRPAVSWLNAFWVGMPPGPGAEEFVNRGICRSHNIPLSSASPIVGLCTVEQFGVQQARPIQLAQNSP